MQNNLRVHEDGDKQFIKILLQVSTHGLNKVDEACASALKTGVSNADFVVQYLTPAAPKEKIEERQLYLIEAPSEDICCYNDAFLSNQLV